MIIIVWSLRDDAAASYTVSNISLEYDIVTQPELARIIRNQYMNKLTVLYDRCLRHRKMLINKSDSLINLNLNISARSLKGILMIFEDLTAGGLAYARDLENGFYNPKITNVSVIIEGISNQLYASGMKSFHM